MKLVSVTNTGEEELVDHFDGEEFVFSPQKTVKIPVEVAQHIFGFGEADKEPFLVRHGWIITKADLKKGLERLAKFRIEGNEPRSNPLAGQRVPLAQSKRDGGKLAIAPTA